MQNLVLLLLLHCLIKISQLPLVHLRGPLEGQPLHQPNLAGDHISNRETLLGTQHLLMTLVVTLIIQRVLLVAQVRS